MYKGGVKHLHKLLLLNHLLKLLHRDVVVVDIARLARARIARRVRHRCCECVGPTLQEELVQRAFPYPAGSADHDRSVVAWCCPLVNNGVCFVGWKGEKEGRGCE